MKLGLDFGNVIKTNGSTDPFPTIKTIEGLRELITIFGEEIYIISRVSEHSHRENTEAWLRANADRIPIARSKWYFCYRREDKAPIAQGLGLTHFVDDRPEVLYHMMTVKNRILMNPTEEDLFEHPIIVLNHWGKQDGLNPIKIVDSWPTLVKTIKETL